MIRSTQKKAYSEKKNDREISEFGSKQNKVLRTSFKPAGAAASVARPAEAGKKEIPGGL